MSYCQSCEDLKSSLKEKEEVNRGLQNACDSWAVLCEELKAENKTLQDAFDNNLKEFMLLGSHAKDLEAENERLKRLVPDHPKDLT